MNTPVRHESSVLEVKDECPGVKTFRLSVPRDFSFSPGMWVMLHFADNPKISRAYSISSSPFEKGYIDISLNHVGEFTSRLLALKPHDLIVLRGPFGKWIYTDEATPAALITGGTGLAPFRSMARYVLAKGLPNKLHIFYSAKTPSAILYRNDLSEFRRRGIAVTIEKNRIDGELLSRRLPGFGATYFYLCGSVSMVETLARDLKKRGIPRERIRYEKWGDFQASA